MIFTHNKFKEDSRFRNFVVKNKKIRS